MEKSGRFYLIGFVIILQSAGKSEDQEILFSLNQNCQIVNGCLEVSSSFNITTPRQYERIPKRMNVHILYLLQRKVIYHHWG